MTEIAEPPRGWDLVRVSDLCTKIDYGFTASADFSLRQPRFLRITDIQNGQVDWEQVPGCSIDPETEESKRLQHGDIVFARTGGTTGKSFLIQQPPRAVFASYLIRLRPCETVLSEWLYQFFQSNLYWSQVRDFARGGAQPNVNAQMLGEITLPVPPLHEQRRIVSILNDQLAAVERAKTAAEAQLGATRALPVAYLRNAFSRLEFGERRRERLGNICELLPSKSIATDGDAEVAAITTACLTEMGFDPSGVKIARMWSQDAQVSKVSWGEVLVARSNTQELVGRVAMFDGIPQGVVASDLTIRIKPSPIVLSPFLASHLSLLYVSGYWKDHAGGASGSMKKITRTQIQNLRVPVPELSRQQLLVSELDACLSHVKKMSTMIQEQGIALEHLTKSLLSQAFNGEI